MISRKGPSPIGHRVVEAGGVIYFSGFTDLERSPDMLSQATNIFRRLDGTLEMAGIAKKDIVFATVYLTRMDLKAQMDEAWKNYFEPADMPGRATVGVADLGENVMIEIAFVGARAPQIAA